LGILAIHNSNETTNYFLPYNIKNSSDVLTISVSNATYMPGQTIYFLGKVNKYNENAKVHLDLSDPANKIVSDFNSLVDSHGIFSGNFIIPNSFSNGKYLLSAFYY